MVLPGLLHNCFFSGDITVAAAILTIQYNIQEHLQIAMPHANGVYSLSITVHIFSSKSFQFFKTFSLDMRMSNIWKLLGKKEKNMPKRNPTESY